MSDQPTTGEGEQLDIVDAVAKYGIKKLEPTGEWQWDQVDDLYRALGIMGIVKCHNAALAAERERSYKLGYGEAVDCNIDAHLTGLREQLAAERLKVDNATENCMSLSKLLYEAKQQLAAERSKVKELEERLKKVTDLNEN